MQSTREIKRRINSVESTKQITRAMEMVAAAKLRKVQERVENARPYENAMRKSVLRVLNQVYGATHPFIETQEGGEPAYLVIAADRGLCAGYNVNVVRKANEDMSENNVSSPKIIAVGRRSRDYYQKRGYEVVLEHLEMEDNPYLEDAKRIAEPIKRMYLEGTINSLTLVFNEFKNPMVQIPRARKILPMNEDVIATEDDTEEELDIEGQIYAFEPSLEVILGDFLEKYFENIIYKALLEGKASEHGARMTAMGNATESADEMIDDLTLTFNRARQASITQELLEIVNAAEALQ